MYRERNRQIDALLPIRHYAKNELGFQASRAEFAD